MTLDEAIAIVQTLGETPMEAKAVRLVLERLASDRAKSRRRPLEGYPPPCGVPVIAYDYKGRGEQGTFSEGGRLFTFDRHGEKCTVDRRERPGYLMVWEVVR